MNTITTPVSAFVTFTTQEAFERCNKYLFEQCDLGYEHHEDHRTFTMLGEPATINEAPDPTNIIWEDQGKDVVAWNNIKANIMMTVLVLAGFCFFFFL